jgi:F420-non-reducing hydrogenase iron-sulfur subunit
MELVQYLLNIAGIGRDRVQVRWVSAAEGQLFAKYVTEVNDITQKLGPFDPDKFELPLAAVERTLTSPRIRWLIGLTKQVTEKGNVYNEKLKKEDFKKMLHQAAEEEYQKALIMQVLEERPGSVREMAEKTGLPVYTVSLRLNELERCNQAGLKEYSGSTPIFMGM